MLRSDTRLHVDTCSTSNFLSLDAYLTCDAYDCTLRMSMGDMVLAILLFKLVWKLVDLI